MNNILKNNNNKKYLEITIIIGLISNLSLLFSDELFKIFWFFFGIFGLIIFTLYLCSIAWSFYRRIFYAEKPLFYVNILFILITCLIVLFQSELLKSKVVLQAIDNSNDLNSNWLILRANGEFEVIWQNPFGSDKFEGKYVIKNDTLIFLDKPYDNDYVPRKLLIKTDRIIPIFTDSLSKHQYFFKITKNEIKL
jgi:c-di-AMP phosphodiesterase-like protein